VDAERDFHRGRLNMTHLQHRLKAETFEAKMCLGSWGKTGAFKKNQHSFAKYMAELLRSQKVPNRLHEVAANASTAEAAMDVDRDDEEDSESDDEY
jgi:hypothetical protein